MIHVRLYYPDGDDAPEDKEFANEGEAREFIWAITEADPHVTFDVYGQTQLLPGHYAGRSLGDAIAESVNRAEARMVAEAAEHDERFDDEWRAAA